MSPEREKLLRDKFPLLFRKVRRIGGGLAPVQTRGIECGDGWFDLIDSLLEIIMQHHDQAPENKANLVPNNTKARYERKRNRLPAVLQIKEKLGSLRFYVHAPNLRMRELITFAEHHSKKVCESCGAPGTFRTDGWLRVHCDACEIAGHYNERR